MRLIGLEVENFRSYRDVTKISFENLTTIIGKNDVGKSTVLEALEIFFNNDLVKIDPSDCNIDSSEKLVCIQCEFSDLPDEISLDAGAPTTLSNEYLLSHKGTLKIKKVFDCSKSGKPSEEVFIVCQHPSDENVADLLSLKEAELQKRVKELDLQTSLKGNPSMRQALWQNCQDLNLTETEISVSKGKADEKRIWEQLQKYIPIFALFQSDRPSQDSDDEIQNPLKAAVASALAEAEEEIQKIEEIIRTKTTEIANLTHSALQEIDPKLADSLNPKYIPPTTTKWRGLFSIGMDTNERIPLNKRGSGVRRLILVSFFKAEAERKLRSSDKSNIIYAIEEPETSQHPDNQKILLKAFKELSEQEGCQVILTTHSPGLASELPTDSIRFISASDSDSRPKVSKGAEIFGEVAETLGLIASSSVKVIVCVEGPTDVQAIEALSEALHISDNNIPNLRDDPRFSIVALGGSNLKHWVEKEYLKNLNLPEVHIYDADVKKYSETVQQVNNRNDGSWAVQTKKYEIECYLHEGAITDAFGFTCSVVDWPNDTSKSVPEAFSDAYLQYKNKPLKSENSKKKLSLLAFPKMTATRLDERDPDGEVRSWFQKMAELVSE